MNPFNSGMAGMPQMPGMPGHTESSTNLFSILVNIAFGFVLGLMLLLGFPQVLTYGTKVAGELIKLTGYGSQMSAFGFASTALPYVVLAPIAGLVVRQLSSIRSFKGFGYFILAVLAGFLIAFFTRGYFLALMQAK
jgi:hypothetical protein